MSIPTYSVINYPIALVEPHDARVAAITLIGDAVSISFAHIPVYHQLMHESCEIWSYSGQLALYGVSSGEVRGIQVGQADVSDATVFADDQRVPWTSLLQRRDAQKVTVVFTSGCSLEILCRQAWLNLEKAIEHIENWTGPL